MSTQRKRKSALELERRPQASELEALLTENGPASVLDAILGSAPAGMIIARASDGKVLRFSDYYAQLIGRPRSDVEGRTVADVFESIRNYDDLQRPFPADQRPLARALRGETVTGCELLAEAADGELIPFVINAAPIRSTCGDVIGAISSNTDIRSFKVLERNLRDALTQRGALYRELTHRVKNHLQIMSGLVSMEARDPALTVADLVELMQGRLQLLATVYDSMTRAGAGARIMAAPFIAEVARPFASGAVTVEAKVDPPDLTLASEQSGPIGMLVNEAMCNSHKHAFPSGGGRIRVGLRRLKPGRLRLEIADNGVGLRTAAEGRVSHGLDLVRLLAKQLHGELELGDQAAGGVIVSVEMPESAEGDSPFP
jgi:PAS domain S-box-containing protein